MHIEQIHVGEAVTVVDGADVTCPTGCCVFGEHYAGIKGVPLVVLGIAPPYLVTGLPRGNANVIIDIRLCVLTKVPDEYLNAFRATTVPLAVTEERPPGPLGPPHDEVCSGK